MWFKPCSRYSRIEAEWCCAVRCNACHLEVFYEEDLHFTTRKLICETCSWLSCVRSTVATAPAALPTGLVPVVSALISNFHPCATHPWFYGARHNLSEKAAWWLEGKLLHEADGIVTEVKCWSWHGWWRPRQPLVTHSWEMLKDWGGSRMWRNIGLMTNSAVTARSCITRTIMGKMKDDAKDDVHYTSL